MSNTSVGLLLRFGAIFYDTLLLFSLIFVLGLLANPLFPIVNNQANPWFFVGITLPVSYLYFCLFWLKQGQTLGMKAWRLRLLSAVQPLTLKTCSYRFLLAIVSYLLLGLGFFYQWFDTQKLTLHDKLSQTKLVKY